ncbi:hypothetical protein ACWDPV_21175 [Gordonia sp. NPDC003504]
MREAIQVQPNPVLTFEAQHWTATLNRQLGTLILNHHGVAIPPSQKKSSPWVIPLGNIVDMLLLQQQPLSEIVETEYLGRRPC